MKYAVVIPTRNSEATLEACLSAIFANDLADAEVWVVDCASKDLTTEIARKFGANVLRLDEGRGKGSARNEGTARSGGDAVIFVDSDVVVPPDAIRKIKTHFSQNPGISAVNGLLSADCPYHDFYSRYKNLYMNYRFRSLPDRIDFLFTSLAAVKKEHLPPFYDELKPKDTEAGKKMAAMGHEILFDRTLEALHLKKYNFLSLLKNDFIVPMGWAQIFIQRQGMKDVIKSNRFAHAPNTQIAAVLLAPSILFCLALCLVWPQVWVIGAVAVMAWIVLNSHFFGFIGKKTGTLFLIKSILFTFLDNTAMAAGIFCGLIAAFRVSKGSSV